MCLGWDKKSMSLIINDFYTADEVAKVYGVNKKTVYRWLDRGLLTSLKEHGLIWIGKEQLQSFDRPRRGRKK